LATADPNDHDVTSEMVDPDAPESVIIRSQARKPEEDPTLGVHVVGRAAGASAAHRLVTLGDSLTHGFQSGAIFNTDLSWPKLVAWELGWDREFRHPRYDGFGGLPLNIEYLARLLEREFGPTLDLWEVPQAAFLLRSELDKIEDWWERGGGAAPSRLNAVNHNLAVYGWDVRDALSRSFTQCLSAIETPKDDLLTQIVQNANDRAALRVLSSRHAGCAAVQAAAELGKQGGIETLVVALGANNALGSVVSLKPSWSRATPVEGTPAYRHLGAKSGFNVWDPVHFEKEWAELVDQLSGIDARHVIVATVPHVTIAPIARGVGSKVRPGSRYFPYYTRPWIDDQSFDPRDDECISARQARAIDSAIDQYNACIVESVRTKRKAGKDWYVLELCGILDRLAQRRYLEDVNARPSWWSPYPLPAELRALNPVPDSRFFSSDEAGRRAGGLFSLDGVHPTTIGYGLVAQEVIRIMELAGVPFYLGDGATLRSSPIQVDFARLIQRDSLVAKPPINLRNAVGMIGWLDEKLDLLRRLARNFA
jgi:hypothetical protein